MQIALTMTAVSILAACTNPGGESTPYVTVTANSISRTAPFEVSFTAVARHVDSGSISFTWDFRDLGEQLQGGANVTRVYLHPGTYTVTVTANTGKSTLTDTITINVLEPQHYGDWIWVAMYPDESFYRGVLSVSLAIPDDASFSQTSMGVWSWEDADGSYWDVPYGLGLMGSFTMSGQTGLMAGLVDLDGVSKLVAVDFDGRIGSEFSGDPSFYGEGVWLAYDGREAPVLVGMRKDSKDLTFPPALNYSPPSLNSTDIGVLSFEAGLTTLQNPSSTAAIDRLNMLLSAFEDRAR